MKSTPGKAPGKKCLADIYGMKEVTPVTIVYMAVVVCIDSTRMSLIY